MWFYACNMSHRYSVIAILSFLLIVVSSMPAEEIREAKSKMRLEIKSKIKALTEDDKIKQTFIITRRLIKHPDFQNAERIAIYVNMKNEVGTYDIIKEAFAGNKTVFIPLVVGENMKMVKLNSFDDLKTMPKTKWGIIQPLESDNREDCLETGGVQYIVVPGVAFTSTGLRLGHGRGYYDRFLAKNDEIRGSRCVTVGLGFDVQIVPDLPVTDRDFRLTWVLSPDLCSLTSKYEEVPDPLPRPPQPFLI